MSLWSYTQPPAVSNPTGAALVATPAGWADSVTGELLIAIGGLSTTREPNATPTLVRVTFDKPAYKHGDTANVIAQYSEAVTVTGTPQATIHVVAVSHTLNYVSGSGTAFLTFAYTVGGTDVATAGNLHINSPLSLNGGTIKGSRTDAKALTVGSVTGTFPVGSTVKGATSHATGIVQRWDSVGGILYVSSVSGTFTSEVVNVIGSGATLGTPVLASYVTGDSGVATVGTYHLPGDPVTNTGVLSVALTVDETTYQNDPHITFTPTGGDSITTMAIAHGVVKAGVLTSVVIDNPGNGYVHAPTVNILTGQVLSIPVTAAGSGYTIPPVIVISDSGSGENATAIAVLVKDGVDHVEITNNGDSYTTGTISTTIGTQGTGTISAIAAPNAPLTFSVDPTVLVAVMDAIAPTVSSATIPVGTYTTHSVLPITVVFSKPVFVVGKPNIPLTFVDSSTTGNAVYSSGSGTTTLVFNYIIQATDAASSGNLTVGNITQVNNSTTNDEVGNHAATTLTVTTTSILINDAPATISSVAVAAGNYTTGQTIPVVVTFNESVYVTGVPTIAITTTGGTRTVNYASGSGTANLTFNYLVVSGDTIGAVSSAATSLTLGGGVFIEDSLGVGANVAFSAPGTFTGVATNDVLATLGTPSGSSTGTGTYPSLNSGDVLKLTFTASKAVTVTGAPYATVTTAGGARHLAYTSGTGTTTLVFSYTTVVGDDGIAGTVSNSSPVVLNGGTMKDSLGIPITLTYTPADLSGVSIT